MPDSTQGSHRAALTDCQLPDSTVELLAVLERLEQAVQQRTGMPRHMIAPVHPAARCARQAMHLRHAVERELKALSAAELRAIAKLADDRNA